MAYQLALAGLLLALLIVFGRGLTRCGARTLALLGLLVAIASGGRALFAAVPSVQPASFVIICAGLWLGPGAGLVVGLLTGLLSNLLLGLGPYTLSQMFLWGLMGLTGAFLRRAPQGALVAFGFVWGFVFGWAMNLVWYTFSGAPLVWAVYLAACAASFWFDFLHAAVNAVLLLMFSKFSLSLLTGLNASSNQTGGNV